MLDFQPQGSEHALLRRLSVLAATAINTNATDSTTSLCAIAFTITTVVTVFAGDGASASVAGAMRAIAVRCAVRGFDTAIADAAIRIPFLDHMLCIDKCAEVVSVYKCPWYRVGVH